MVETMLEFSLEDHPVTYLPELLNRITFLTFVPTLLVSHRKACQTDAKKIQDDDDDGTTTFNLHKAFNSVHVLSHYLNVDCCSIKYIVAW